MEARNQQPATSMILVGIIGLGLALRLYLLVASGQYTDGDEALVGIQAFDIMRGGWPLFIAGQAYSASFESYLAALVFWPFGASTLTLKLVPLISSLVFIALTYELARRIYDPAVGLLSALFVAVCPLLLTHFSLKAWGGYAQAPVVGNVALLILLRLWEPARASRWAWGLGLGMVCGFGMWIHPQFLYYLAPIGGLLFSWAVWRFRKRWKVLVAFAVGLCLGALPILLGNLGHTGKITTSEEIFGNAVPAGDFWPALKAAMSYLFLTDGLLTLWGAHPLRGDLVIGPALLVVPVYVAALGYAVWRSVRKARRRESDSSLILLIFLLFAPLVFAFGALTIGNYTIIIPGSGLLARYVGPLYTPMPILLAAMLVRLWAARRWLAIPLAVLVLAVNVWSNLSADPVQAMRTPWENVPLPADNRPLIRFLESNGIRHVYTHHMIGYRLIFESQERIAAFDYRDSLSRPIRFPRFAAEVEQATTPPAYVIFNPPWERLPPLEEAFHRLGVTFSKEALPPYQYIVYYDLSRKVHPSEVMDALVWPYY